MAKVKNDYFQLIEQQVSCCVEASTLLLESLSGYNAADNSANRDKIHAVEHQADNLHHDILTRLSAEFITPIDQEDILHLVQIVDDITDALDEVMLHCYMYHVETLPARTLALAAVVDNCVKALHEAAKELKNFKKPDALRKLLVQVNSVEGEADALHTEAIHQLFGEEQDVKSLFSSMAIYDGLENCCDLCEHAADVIEQIIIKNT